MPRGARCWRVRCELARRSIPGLLLGCWSDCESWRLRLIPDNGTLVLAMVYDKGEQADLTVAQRKNFEATLKVIGEKLKGEVRSVATEWTVMFAER